MIKRILRDGLLTSLLQMILYLLILRLSATIQRLIFKSREMYISEVFEFVDVVQYLIILLAALLLATNIVTAIINKKIWTWGALIFVTLIYLIACNQYIHVWPWRITLFIVEGLVIIFSKPILEKAINRLLNYRLRKNHQP
jgi:hypothetical protein